MITQFMQFVKNPGQYMNKMGIPQGMQNNPQAAIQYLMDNGRLSQAQYNQAQEQAKQMQSTLQGLR